MNKVFKVGLIGCGHISETYFRAEKYFNNIKIVKCADINHRIALKCAKTYKIKALSVRELLKDQEVEIILNLTIPKAKEKVPDAEFFVQDIQKHYKNWVKQPKDDLVIASGVLCIFDDYEKILNNILSCTRKNGVIIIRTIINYDPIDVIMRYKRSGSNEWESGWNILSKETLNDFLINKKFIESVDWDDYIMPFEIKKNSHDVMRAHTKLINNQKILVNGACQILNQTNLIIKLKK